MKPLVLKPFTSAATGDYPYGNIIDDDGSGNGTPINMVDCADQFQFFEKIFAESGLTANNLPDNAYSGFQLYQALLAMWGGTRSALVPIGAWNMNTTATWQVALPAALIGKKIISVRGTVRHDVLVAGANNFPITQGLNTAAEPDVYIDYVGDSDSTPANTIILKRSTGGIFHASAFASLANRGDLIVEYLP